MQGLYISPKGIKGGANLSQNYTTNVLLENMDENTQKFANLVVSNLVSLFENNPEHAIDYLDFNLVFNGNFDDISNNISFEDFIKSNSERIVAIFKSVKSSDTKSFIVDFVQTETDYKYDYVYLKLSKLFEIFNSYGIEYKVDENSRVQQHGIYNEDNSTRIIVSYAHAKKYHVGIVSGPTFMSQFMDKLKNGELTLDTCPQVKIGKEFSGTTEEVNRELESYQKLLESGIVDEILEEEFKINQSILSLQEEKIKLESPNEEKKQKRIPFIRKLIEKYPILEVFTKEYREETEYREFIKEHINDFRLGENENDNVVTSYLDSHLEGGIKQENLDKILDIMDEYVEVAEATTIKEQGSVKKLVPNNKK